MATFATSDQLLVIIDPGARQTDGESVRIAKDVLSAGAAAKVCLPEGPEEFARALGRRGSRRPVVVGDDTALIRAVTLLHRERELAGCVLSVVPVGEALALARSLGVPTGAVAAARAVLDGEERRLDLLADESDGLVLAGGETEVPVARRKVV
ncbi:diacylglycerol kinase family protein, partial [Streptomyces sp. NPDC001034]|uniref:diacylglycerol kinase family protein n=1 Tax=Streptomyces sp. NPDC001034 TaxID=3154375 RepID=UPI003318DB0D